MKGYPLRTVWLLTVGIACCLPSGGAGLAQNTPAAIEITQVDLFTLKEWDSGQVAFSGFRLGMKRNEAFRNAQARELALDDDFGQGCLKAPTCYLLQSGRYIGLSMSFGIQDSIQRIRIETPSSDGSKKDRESWMVRKLRGQTSELFENYSDSLRARLLGIANANWSDAPRPGGRFWISMRTRSISTFRRV